MSKQYIVLSLSCFFAGILITYLKTESEVEELEVPSALEIDSTAEAVYILSSEIGVESPTTRYDELFENVAVRQNIPNSSIINLLKAWSFDNDLSEIHQSVQILLEESPELALRTALSELPLNQASTLFRKEIFKSLIEESTETMGLLVTKVEEFSPIHASEARQALLSALAETHPEYALKYLNETKHFDNIGAVADIFNRLAATDPQRAIKLLDRAGPLESRTAAAKMILPYLLDTGISDLASLSSLFSDPSISYSLTTTALQTLAVKDPDKAAQLALSEKHITRRREYLSGVAVVWVDHDPDAYFSFVNSLEPAKTRDQLRAIGIRQLSSYDIERATEQIRNTSSFIERSNIVGEVARIMAVENPHETLEWLKSFSVEIQESAMPEVLSQLAAVDPELTRTLIDRQVAHDKLANAIGTVIVSMAETDPKAALEYANTLHSDDLVDASTMHIYHIWAQNDLEAAYNAAMIETSADKRSAAIDVVAEVWMYQDPHDFINWAAELSGPERNHFYEKGITTLAQLDSNEAAKHFDWIVEDHLEEGENPERFIRLATEIAGTFASAAEAISWSQQHENEKMRSASLEQAAAQWAVLDPEQLKTEIDNLDSQLASGLRITAAREMARGDPLSAFDVAVAIADPGERLDTLAYVYSYAIDLNDKQADRALANTSGIRPDEIETIIEISRKYQ